MKKKKRTVWPWLVLLAAIALGGAYTYDINKFIYVETAVVARGDILETASETGTVTARNACTILAKSSFEVASLSVSVGDAVSRGQLILTAVKDAVQPTDKGVLEAQLAGVQAQLAQARERTETLWGLFSDGALSWKEFEDASTAVTVLEAQETSLKESIRETDAPAPRLNNDVNAPFAGVVTELHVAQGDTAVIGRPLLQITDPTELYIKVGILESDAVKIDLGSRVLLTGLGGEESVVTAVAPKVRQSVSDLGTVQKRKMMDVMIPVGQELALGADVDLEIITAEANDVPLIPRKAVLFISEKDYVFVEENGIATLREVATGLSNDEYFEVVSGLRGGETIIVSPNRNLAEGSAVRPMS